MPFEGVGRDKRERQKTMSTTDSSLTAKFLADTLTNDDYKKWRNKYYPLYHQFLNAYPLPSRHWFLVPETSDYPPVDIRLELRTQQLRRKGIFDRWDREIEEGFGVPPPEGLEDLYKK